MIVSLLAAMSKNRVIGREGRLPWRLPDDLRRFKALTRGRTIVMGRRTLESIGGPLPQRRSIVITRNPDAHVEGVKTAGSLDEALSTCAGEDEVFIIGGGEIYRQALPRADRIYLTLVLAEIEGDTFFPEFEEREWRLVEDELHEADARHRWPMRFQRYDRRSRPGKTAGE